MTNYSINFSSSVVWFHLLSAPNSVNVNSLNFVVRLFIRLLAKKWSFQDKVWLFMSLSLFLPPSLSPSLSLYMYVCVSLSLMYFCMIVFICRSVYLVCFYFFVLMPRSYILHCTSLSIHYIRDTGKQAKHTKIFLFLNSAQTL